uniref:Uncharacterized protein n=1 Tax=Chrysotila carterae TaxID=13221 RepID=A0A7S4C694_CHRCT|mmetsp:Transcript_14319/g.30234  ORF Transcript_14319/g.30234 Transcript_14319/m.30234 type:complete len:148 (-) Transcript_14319:487-930(-)|eukprot:6180327-Pleurochrysis_carterae.AAC.3
MGWPILKFMLRNWRMYLPGAARNAKLEELKNPTVFSHRLKVVEDRRNEAKALEDRMRSRVNDLQRRHADKQIKYVYDHALKAAYDMKTKGADILMKSNALKEMQQPELKADSALDASSRLQEKMRKRHAENLKQADKSSGSSGASAS